MSDPWEYFQYRWDRLQSAEIGRNTRDLAGLQQQVVELEKLLVYLVGRMALGEKLGLDDPEVRRFLHLGDAEDPERAVLAMVRGFEQRTGPKVVECPRCGAGVRDLPGVTDERCGMCGEVLEPR